MIVGFLLHRQADGQEVVHGGAIEDGDGRAIDTLDAMFGGDTLRRIDDRRAAVCRALDQFMRDAARVLQRHTGDAETLDLLRVDPLPVQAVNPIVGGADRNGLLDDLGLIGSAAAINGGLAEGKGGDDGRGFARPRSVIEMVDRDHAVKQDGALDRIEAKGLRVEIIVFLNAVGAERQVMIAADKSHSVFLRNRPKSPDAVPPP